MKQSVVLLVVVAALASEAKTVNVFFAGGQSNAKAEWASAIASGLQSGYGTSLVMVYTNHSGQALANWYTTAPQANYSNDMWNASGTGLLQSQISSITNAGDQAVFRGFFWFQGESDTGSNTSAYAVMDAYTNRFTGMLSQLKADLGMTNEIRFCLAVIDADPSADYDDDLSAGGRDRACIEYFRTNQVFLGSMPTGSYVDTRGYARSDVWHLTPSELTRLGTAMSGAYTNKFGISPPLSDGTIEIISPDADGAIYPTGIFAAQDLVCGSGGTPNTTPFNGIAFFRLPAYRIASADLSMTVQILYGSWPTAGANLDVWGLGYMTAPLMDKGWLLQADTDPRVLLNFRAPSKIADNWVASTQTPVVNSVLQLNAQQRTNLTSFLNGLYDQGAQPGDYAVIRVNQDAVITAGGVSVRFGGSERTSPDHRSKLTVSLSDTNATAQTFVHFSPGPDGAVSAAAVMSTVDLISGTGGANVDFSGFAFLTLPEQPMTSVSLALTAAIFTGVLSNANVDVWGLGYMTTPNMSTNWLCTSDADARVFPVGKPVKLADNIVTAGQTVAVGTVWVPTASQEKTLVRYLNGLYNQGAKPGDFAVIRVNMDASEAGYSRGVRWGASHRTLPDWRPRLAGTYMKATNYLKNADFEFGSGNTVSNWVVAYNNFLGQRTNDFVRCGSFAYRLAVNGDQSMNGANNINLAQDVYSPDFAGRVVTFCGHARHNTIEPLVTNSAQKVEFRIYWLGVSGTPFITSSDSYNLLPADAKDVYKPVFITGLAPTNATGVRAQVIFRTGTTTNSTAITSGAAIVDDVRLSVFEPVFPEGTLLRVW